MLSPSVDIYVLTILRSGISNVKINKRKTYSLTLPYAQHFESFLQIISIIFN